MNCHEFLENTFGKSFASLPSSKIGAGSKFMEAWESIKHSFNGKDLGKVYRLNLPALGKSLKTARLAPSSYDFDDFDILISGYALRHQDDPYEC